MKCLLENDTIMKIPKIQLFAFWKDLIYIYYTSEFCGLKNKMAFVLSLHLQYLEINLNRKCVYLIRFFYFLNILESE